MCAEALWIQEIKPLFNSMKTLIIVLEFAMYSLELEMKLKKRIEIYFRPTYPIFFHNVSRNTAFFFNLALLKFLSAFTTIFVFSQTNPTPQTSATMLRRRARRSIRYGGRRARSLFLYHYRGDID
jgi:hypothetical protein